MVGLKYVGFRWNFLPLSTILLSIPLEAGYRVFKPKRKGENLA